jgi:hypothetical protein
LLQQESKLVGDLPACKQRETTKGRIRKMSLYENPLLRENEVPYEFFAEIAVQGKHQK